MNFLTTFGAALMLALLFASPALDLLNFKPFGDSLRKVRKFSLYNFLRSELGAVTVTYKAAGGDGMRILDSITPPTAIQAAECFKQVAIVVFGVTADSQALFTHNWGLSASAPGYYDPEVFMEPISTTTSWPLITFWRANTNVLVIGKPATDAPTTIAVTIRRPHSIGQ